MGLLPGWSPLCQKLCWPCSPSGDQVNAGEEGFGFTTAGGQPWVGVAGCVQAVADCPFSHSEPLEEYGNFVCVPDILGGRSVPTCC